MDSRFTAQLTLLQTTLMQKPLSKADAILALLQSCIDTLQIQRVGLWLYTDDDLMCCQMLLDKTAGVTQEALLLDRWSFPVYFAALDNSEVIRAVDAYTNPATAELCEHFLRPLNIRSLLDVPIKPQHRVVGIICCEQTAAIKHWTLDEVQFVKALCGLYSENIH